MFLTNKQREVVQNEVQRILERTDLMDGRGIDCCFLVHLELQLFEEPRWEVEIHIHEEAFQHVWDAIDEVDPNESMVGDDYISRHSVLTVDQDGNVSAHEEH